MYNSMYECTSVSLLCRKIFLQVKYDLFLTVCALPTQHDLYLPHSVANRDQEIPFLLGFCEVCEAAPEHSLTIIKMNRNKGPGTPLPPESAGENSLPWVFKFLNWRVREDPAKCQHTSGYRHVSTWCSQRSGIKKKGWRWSKSALWLSRITILILRRPLAIRFDYTSDKPLFGADDTF